MFGDNLDFWCALLSMGPEAIVVKCSSEKKYFHYKTNRSNARGVALDAANRLIHLFLNLLNKNGPMSIHVVAEEKI